MDWNSSPSKVFKMNDTVVNSSEIVLNKIKTILNKILHHSSQKESELNTSTTFTELRMDSLDMIEFIMALEKEFSIDIYDEDFDSLTNVQLVLDYVIPKL